MNHTPHLVNHSNQEVVLAHDPSAYVVGRQIPHHAKADVLLEEHNALEDFWPSGSRNTPVTDT